MLRVYSPSGRPPRLFRFILLRPLSSLPTSGPFRSGAFVLVLRLHRGVVVPIGLSSGVVRVSLARARPRGQYVVWEAAPQNISGGADKFGPLARRCLLGSLRCPDLRSGPSLMSPAHHFAGLCHIQSTLYTYTPSDLLRL